ncbi:MAG: DEAD/DEAH box helicase [Verrucomicrobiae bacterium]|nr:DEAD/DEAH box helicase [Verrucomicrobiae bacterium]MCB1090093.1 DEAD/DEAH box helicase [Verrucomicrobiae bacterium]
MSTSAFELLDRRIQRAIWELEWEELRPLQVDTIQKVLTTDQHLIVSAATASGKTEAAFLPILSKIVEDRRPSIQALYVSPLKALINDQFRRLETLCAHAEIPVHRWHGDVDGEKKRKLREKPGGVLLITPESLESNFINYGSQLARIYQDLSFVVIDEVHTFLDDVRGIHLQSLLSRLRAAANLNPRMLGLSATLADFAPARRFLDLDDPQRVDVVEDSSNSREIRIGVKSFIDHESGMKPDREEEPTTPLVLKEVAQDVGRHFREGANLIFTTSRRLAETVADELQQIAEEHRWPRNPFYVHHGSLSRGIREEVESRLKAGEPISALCTSTLEMGIDIGAVKTVGQIGPVWTVSSMVQRMGRSGRKEGQPAVLRLYCIDEFPGEGASITEQLYPELLQSVAMVELMLEKWLEPIDQDSWHLSTCIHQVLSVLRQTGGTRADRLFEQLCVQGPFRRVDAEDFKLLLRGLASQKVIEQIPTGELILAPLGERTVESRDFYAAFSGGRDFRVIFGSNEIGLLPSELIPPEGHHLILNGRRWQVEEVDPSQEVVFVRPSKGKAPPMFLGNGGDLHDRVVSKMREVLSSERDLAYLHPSARETLERAKALFRRVGLMERDFIRRGDGIEWFPWVGGAALTTIALAGRQGGLKMEADRLSVRINGDSAEIEAFLENLAEGRFTAEELAEKFPTKEKDRFDPWVAEELLDRANAASQIKLGPAQVAAERLLGQL